jgi:hypothetical protein
MTLRLAIRSPALFLRLCWLTSTRLVLRRKRERARSLSQGQREEAFTRFRLASSDQQLVVGLATLIAAKTNQGMLSLYEFPVALALTWFSSTTHLAALDHLRHYPQQHQTIRNWRVYGMCIFFVLFSYCFAIVVLAAGRPGTVPVACSSMRGIQLGGVVDILLISSIVARMITFMVLVTG